MSKGEIRGLKAGTFFANTDESVLLRISRTDNGVVIELVDIEADSVYKFGVTSDAENNSEIPFKFNSLSEITERNREF